MHGLGTNFFTLGGGSMLFLLAMFAVLLTYIIERTVFLHSGNVKPQPFIAGIVALLKNDRYGEAMTICEETHGFVPAIVKIALFFGREDGGGDIDYAVRNFVLSVIPTLERRLRSIALIGKISPMVGCIGACVIFSKFLTITSDTSYLQSSSLFALTGNMLTIVPFALFINVCANVGYNFLYGRVRALIYDMEWSYMEIVNFIKQADDEK
jgi:biopolymer transport protein ExbB/TolQ